VFPHNIGLGATRDPRLVERVEHVTAEETRATGPQWVFAPCVCVARDLRWGRTYESFGEDPGLVIKMETAIDGFQGPRARELDEPDRVLATAKHYAGDGDTEYGTGSGDYPIDQGITVTSRPDFARIDLSPYVAAVHGHDIGSVMPSFSSVDWTEDGVGNPLKMHAHRELITGVLKHKLGFDGFVISDWEGIHQLPGDYAAQVRTGVNAGIDMFMEPYSYQQFETTLLAEVAAGRVSEARIDDAVRRILVKKFELGLFEHPFTDRRHLDEVGSPAHRALARRAVSESQVLLKNHGKVLPCRATSASTSPAATPTTSATRPAAGRWPGRACRVTSSPATPSWTASARSPRTPRSPSARTPRPPRPGPTSASWSWARPRTPRASATSAGRCGRTTACPANPRPCGSTTPTGPPSTGSAGASTGAWSWSSRAGR